ncbi:acyl-CoA/acyl-ACP dehydrogenase [Amycolatopsis acidiphila]|uniref:Acyl-CoA dehydrogenase n=1 Tax=Amycolatopsis acidiphila TaxID=715473 RepID=A0A558AA70_9PSEU|nr:acyl-CoA dehydrogenase family protein [Amycolatopsis acidiphila]TVT21161.1 acyl-CoA dehydrogenase [Amycolatopsis acidiphila]UIJ57249.1 acyl-CoA/acyl-ACP dehydrogenase [Amycolatopsis acidiphila]GHG52409.1 acyl-CoA dehydrogenase [Amycolatopsis acidiphila]
MRGVLTEEQVYLRKTVRELLADRAARTTVPEQASGHDRELWSVMARQVGLHGLAVPERYGGAGCGPVELAVVFEEMGAVLLTAPFLASAGLAATALLACGDERACAEYLPGIVSGDRIGTLALTEDGGRWDEPGVRLAATGGDGWRLSGRKTYVLDGGAADFLVVAGRTSAGVSLFAVEATASGLTREPVEALDPTRSFATVTFDATPARLLGEEGAGWPALSRTLDLGAVYLASEQVGAAQRSLDMAVDHARTRVQFGRPIGSFQAIKHKCADLLVAVELARSAALFAAEAAAEGSSEAPVLASLAKAVCSEGFVRCATENIQIHGGIGFTWEHPAQLYFKRARADEVLLGTPGYHRRLLAARGADGLPVGRP